MKTIYKRIVVIKIVILQSETEPEHFQTTTHVINEYTEKKYNTLFAKLRIIEDLYYKVKRFSEEYGNLGVNEG